VLTLRALCLRNIASNMDDLWVPLAQGCNNTKGSDIQDESSQDLVAQDPEVKTEIDRTEETQEKEENGNKREELGDEQKGPNFEKGEKQWNVKEAQEMDVEDSEQLELGPFNSLTGDLVSDLMKIVREMGLMKKHYLEMFLLPQLQQLDLSLYETNDLVLRMIGDRCKNLKKLYLCWNVAVGARDLNYIVHEATKVTHLNVAGTKCDDNVVDSISRHCSELRDLDVSDCNVTNKGVLYLCGGHQPNLHRLPHLMRLNLTGTKVDTKGVGLVLKKMKSIRYLEHEWLWDILYDIHTPFNPGQPVPEDQKLALQKIYFLGSLFSPMVNKAVDVLCAFCPYLTEVSIFGCGFDDQSMFKLSKLTNLKVFCLDGGRNMVTFRWGLLPFLHERGATLKEMSLTQVSDLNMVEVSTYCVNLEKLCLIDVSTTIVNHVKAKSFLLSLKQLEIRQHMIDKFGEDVLKFILKNCHNIQQVNLFNINFISDNVLTEMMDSNPLHDLQKITFDRSLGYTSDMIIKLIGHCNSLACCHVADANVREIILNHVRSNNYDVIV